MVLITNSNTYWNKSEEDWDLEGSCEGTKSLENKAKAIHTGIPNDDECERQTVKKAQNVKVNSLEM